MSQYRWLNDLSQQFLDRDYLLPGQTVDERVDIISKTAETRLNKPGFAAKFKEYFQNGWYSLSTPIWSNFGTDRGLPISCVVGDTFIKTKHGDKKAKDIRVGDEVLTHKCRYKKITDIIITKYRSDIYKLKVYGKDSIFLTGDHLVLTSVGWVRTDKIDKHSVATSTDWLGHPYEKPVYFNVESVERTDRKEDVYDFTVEEDHSFSAAGVVLHNCFGSHIDDSMESILKTHSEVGMMTKYGGGTSAYFGELRGRGEIIRNNGQSSGSVHFMQLFDKLITVVSQGSTRRGQFAAYLPIDHADIEEFLTIRSEGSPLQDISYGVCVPDAWMESMIAGDRAKRSVWAKVLASRANVGYPYIFFTDNANKGAPEVYQEKGMRIRHSNLCVTGDQRVVSQHGLKTAKELHEMGSELQLFDGEKVVSASRMKLIEENVDVYRITLANGMTHTVTGYHKVKAALKDHYDARDVICLDLKPGDSVAIQSKKGLFGSGSDFNAISGCAASFDYYSSNGVPEPIWTASEKAQWLYVRKIFHYCGKFDVSNGFRLRWTSASERFIQDLQILLTNLGVKSFVNSQQIAGEFICQLVVDDKKGIDTINLNSSILHDNNVDLGENWVFEGDNDNFSEVVSVEYVGKQDVYCCTVDSEEHYWVCNGIITHNCTEIFLPNKDDESFVCDLSSMNIAYFDEWKDTDAVELIVYFLDSVMSEFIDKAKKLPYMERAVNFAERHRALGLGWLGWHTYLQSKMVPFESIKAKGLNALVGKTIFNQAMDASIKMGWEYGEPEYLQGYGRRNTTLCAIAPTKSSAFILGQVSEGVEPHRSNYYIKDLQKGKFTIKNPHLEQLLRDKGKDTPDVWDSILRNAGSVQHLDFLSEQEKAVFKTFVEITPLEIVTQAAQRQKYIDQGQSLNLMIHPSIPTKDVNALVIEAWKQGVKSLYYQISVNAAQQFSREIMSCTSCQS